jgi:hypothetical protein
MKTNRPRVSVSRRRVLGFTGTEHRHPFITGERDATCSTCHVADLAALESRITGKPFRHDTHLPAAAKSGDCKNCHTRMEGSTGPADIVPYDPPACGDCHKGAPLEAIMEPGATPVNVPLFAHADHAAVACTDCHNGNVAAGAADISLLPKVDNCVLCHGHQNFPGVTGGLSGGYVQNCLNCHAQGTPSKRSPARQGRGDWIIAVEGAQFHPENAPCETCHAGSGSRMRAAPPPNVLATGFFKGAGLPGRFHTELRLPPEKTACLCCHWGGPQGAGAILQNFNNLKQARHAIGPAIEGFPGPGCSGNP